MSPWLLQDERKEGKKEEKEKEKKKEGKEHKKHKKDKKKNKPEEHITEISSNILLIYTVNNLSKPNLFVKSV